VGKQNTPLEAERLEYLEKQRTHTDDIDEIERRVLREFFDTLPVPACSVTLDGKIRLCNRAALEFLGYDHPEELVDKPVVSTLYAPSSRRKAGQLVKKWQREGRLHGEELQVLTRAGEVRDVLLFLDTVPSRDGKHRYILSLHFDLTERKRVETALRLEQERSRMYLDMAGVILLALDTEGRVNLINPKGCAVLEGGEEDILGKSWFESFVPLDQREKVRGVFAELMRGAVDPVEYAENEVLTCSGETRVVAWHNTLIKAADGTVLGSFSSGEDITERRAVEDALRESERRYRELADTLPQVVYEMGRDGRLSYANRVAFQMFGYSRKDFERGLNAVDMIAPEDRERAARDVAEALLHPPSGGSEYMAIRRDGSRFPILIHSSRIIREGEVSGLRGIIVDLSEQKAAESALRDSEERLRQSHKMEAIGRLAGGIAHDFNNLLTVILGYSNRLLSDHELSEEAKQETREIVESSQRAASLVNQLLAFSRKQVLHPKSLNLNELIGDLSKMLGRLIPENIQLKTELDSEIGLIKADPVQLQQAIINLAVNARDSMPGGGTLAIATGRVVLDASHCGSQPEVAPGGYVLLTVSDTGHGIDEEARRHLFEPFFTTKEVGKGTGLGLASVFGTVKQSGGYIYAHSEVGQGTAFKIYLPELPRIAETRSPTPELAEQRGGGERILLVEDDPALRKMTCAILERAGYAVTTAADGEEARRLIGLTPGAPFQLLVTDVVMPRMGGRELAELARERLPGLKVLYMSGYTRGSGVPYDIRDAGIEFVEKPFSPRSFANKVRELLNRA
jgi:two-component system cell cycle sensor histidine kinase/response regulator CckA